MNYSDIIDRRTEVVALAKKLGAQFDTVTLPNGKKTIYVSGKYVDGGGCYQDITEAALVYLSAATRTS